MEQKSETLEQKTLSPAWHALHLLPGGSIVKATIDLVRYEKAHWHDEKDLFEGQEQALNFAKGYAARMGFVLYVAGACAADMVKVAFVYKPAAEYVMKLF
jgi:hypothetical protein